MSEDSLTSLENEGGPTVAEEGQSGGGVLPNGLGIGSLPTVDADAPFGRKADGTPRKSNAGRRPGQPLTGDDVPRETAGQKAARLSRVRPKPESEQAPTDVPLSESAQMRVGIDHVSLGAQAAYLFVLTGSLVLGDEFQPDRNAEGFTREGLTDFNAVRDAFAQFFKQKGIDKIDPTVGLAIALVAYTAKRATKPAVRTRFERAWGWCREKTSGMLGMFNWRRST